MAQPSNQTQLAVQGIRSVVESEGYKKRFAEMLGKRAPQFIASISNLASSSEYLARCEPKTIVLSAVKAAVLDLPIEPSLGFAYIVPYGTTATFQIGYRGLIQLALRSGQYASMRDAKINKEAFQGFDEVGEPMIDWKAIDEEKEPIGYAFAWRTVNGFKKTVYWTREKCIVHARKYSKSFTMSSSAWKTNPDEMCLKTVIRAALGKYGVLSIEMRDALASEDVELELNSDGMLIPKGENLDVQLPAAAVTTVSDVIGKPTDATDASKTEKTYTAEERAAILKEVETAMLDASVGESKVMTYVHEKGLAKEGQDEVGALSTEVLAQLIAVIPSLKKGHK